MLDDPDGGSPLASVVAEIRVHSASGFYDFDAKYLPEEQVDLDVPAQVEPELADKCSNWRSGPSRRSAVRALLESTSS